jgi:hypothetical protein
VEEGSPEMLKEVGAANRKKLEEMEAELGTIFASGGILSFTVCFFRVCNYVFLFNFVFLYVL